MTPTLSQVKNWDIKHLTEAANHWTATAEIWEDCFTQYATQVLNPGGEPWEGKAAEAAQYRAYSDRLIVVGLADQLHDASKIARTGAWQLAEAQRRVMRSVESAQGDGFVVGEDFSVTDHHVYNRAAAAMRQAKAEGYAADLRAAVGELVATDLRIAREITTATEGLGKDHFAESGVGVTDKLLDNLVDGTQAATTPPKDTLLGALASGTPSSDVPSVVDDTAGASPSFSDLKPKDFIPSRDDWMWNGVGAAVGSKTDVPGYFVEKAMKDVAKGEPGHWVKTAFSESGWKFLKIRPASGALAAPFLLWNIQHDMEDPEVSIRQAVAKEGGGFIASALAGAGVGTLVGGPAGTALGLIVGAAAGAGVGNLIDKVWEPSANAIGKVLSVFGG